MFHCCAECIPGALMAIVDYPWGYLTRGYPGPQVFFISVTGSKLGSPGTYPDSKVHGANMGPIWGRQGPGGPHVGPMNFAIWVGILYKKVHLHRNKCNSLFIFIYELSVTILIYMLRFVIFLAMCPFLQAVCWAVNAFKHETPSLIIHLKCCICVSSLALSCSKVLKTISVALTNVWQNKIT